MTTEHRVPVLDPVHPDCCPSPRNRAGEAELAGAGEAEHLGVGEARPERWQRTLVAPPTQKAAEA